MRGGRGFSGGCLFSEWGGFSGWRKRKKKEKVLTHVTKSETKKSSATLVYPQAAVLASIAILLLRVVCTEAALVPLETRGLGLSGSDAMLTV